MYVFLKLPKLIMAPQVNNGKKSDAIQGGKIRELKVIQNLLFDLNEFEGTPKRPLSRKVQRRKLSLKYMIWLSRVQLSNCKAESKS